MKIIQISAAYKPAYIYGGPTMSVAMLCETLAGVGNEGEIETKVEDEVEVEVLTTTANGKTELDITNEQILVDGVKVTYYKRITKDHTHFSPALLSALNKKISQFRRSETTKKLKKTAKLVVHIHAWWNLVSLLSCQVAKWHHVPVVLSPRGMLTSYTLSNRNVSFKSIIHQFLGKKLLKYCHIHVTSNKEKEDVLQFVQPRSITVIPNLVSLPNRRDAGNYTLNNIAVVEKPSFKLIFLSRVEEKKGLPLLFEALSELKIDWTLSIAGTGDNNYIDSLHKLTEDLKIREKINWLGHISNDEKFELLAAHDLMVLTSYNENFANVVIESLAVGTPVLLSAHVGLADFVVKETLGWVTALDKESIKMSLLAANSEVSKHQNIRNTAPGFIADFFKPTKQIQQYLALYQTINNDEQGI